MRAAAAVAATELRRFTRDRTALLFVLVLPVVVIVVIGSTFAASPSSLPIGVVVVDSPALDGDDAGKDALDAVVAALEEADTIETRSYASRAELDVAIRTGAMSGGVVVDAAGVTVVIDQAGSNASAVRSTLRGIVDRVHTLDAVVTVTGLPRGQVEQAGAMLDPIGVERVTVDDGLGSSASPFSYTAPSNLVLFTFINSLTAAGLLVAARREGITQRWAAAPVRTSSLVVGLLASRLVFALTQATLILVIGGVLFGVRWGDPLGVAVVLVLFATLATGTGVLVGASASNPEQTAAVGVPVSLGLAMLGGCMWPLEVVGDAIRTVGHATPHAWAMDAFVTLIFDRGGLADIAVEVGVLAGFAVVVITAAVATLSRRLV